MCGIAGYIDTSCRSDIALLKKMAAVLAHRGPDDAGEAFFQESTFTAGCAHRRLSIIDLSPAAHQPMFSDCGTVGIVLNGEIYNFTELRSELEREGVRFSSNSDTEVVLRAYMRWGMPAVHRFIGMFACAIYDRTQRKLFLLRDRTGIKPLYYYHNNGLFLFASELKSFHEHPGFTRELNLESLSLYFKYACIPEPYAVFKYTAKLRPGTWLAYDLRSHTTSEHVYWDPTAFACMPKLAIDYAQACRELTALFSSAFSYRMVSDVPVGLFLSGGYDSSLVAAVLQRGMSHRLKTFTIGFHEDEHNEARYARNVAAHLATDHTEYICTHRDAIDILPQLPLIYDEPFADPSAIPTCLVSRLARRDVTVALSADGGDELFGGYTRIHRALRNTRAAEAIPRFFWRAPLAALSALRPFLKTGSMLEFKRKYARLLAAGALGRCKNLELCIYNEFDEDITALLTGLQQLPPTRFDDQQLDCLDDTLDVMLCLEYQTYLPADILTKVDRASMAASLEAREPLLDHRIYEFAARLPSAFKVDGNQLKKILKDIAHDCLPPELMQRPKHGFSLPIYAWLRKDLRELLLAYMNDHMVASSGLLDRRFVAVRMREFLKGNDDLGPFIWKTLMFQMWYCRWMT
ncbi:MAG: asparagine synthase (glutamine-hydrolyzing) [Deltaproteobacteria bacterium]|nr:asparagine synthase (glutamine-hydrolyzing) [Deltaproteobacteria bacterium]